MTNHCQCESGPCGHGPDSCSLPGELFEFSVDGQTQTLCPHCAKQANTYCEKTGAHFFGLPKLPMENTEMSQCRTTYQHQILFTANESAAYGLAGELEQAKIHCHVKHIKTYEGTVNNPGPTSEAYLVVIRNWSDFNRAVEIRNTHESLA